jgi:hypothetical protein
MTTPSLDLHATRRRARVAYEIARLRVGALRSLALVAVVGVAAFVSLGAAGLAWLPLTAVVWTAIEWRGGAILRGGRIGAGVGLAALAIPVWAFRTCCRAGDAMMGADCCNMTGACTAVGALLGLTLAVFLVRMPRAHRAENALGMGLALVAVASVRCAGLLAGEALGLMGGLAAGAIASSLVAVVVDRMRATSAG